MRALAVALISAGVLAYEVLLTRLFAIVHWHGFAAMVISVALLGFAASGTFVSLAEKRLAGRFTGAFVPFALLFALTGPAGFALAQTLPFNALEIVWNPRQVPYLLALYAVLAVPFFCGATCIVLALAAPGAAVARVYAADLLGAGVGALGVVLALVLLPPLACLALIAALGVAGAACALMAGRRRFPALGLAFAAVLTALAPLDAWMPLRVSPYKGLSVALEAPGARIVAERSNPLGLLHVVASPTIPFRHAPGLSLNATAEPPQQLGLFTDAEALSPITAFDGDLKPLAYLGSTTDALPFHLMHEPEVLILGAGGGAPVLSALYHGAARVDAVEANPLVIDLVDGAFGGFSGEVYTRPPVHPHARSARGFLAATDRTFDLIILPPAGSFRASAAGALGLGQNHTLTVEGFEAALRRLAKGGILALTVWVDIPPRATLKLAHTAIVALERLGVADPAERLAMIRGWQTATLILKNGVLDGADRAAVRRFADERAFDLVHLPGMAPDEANRFNRLDGPLVFEATQRLLGPGRDAFVERYKFDLRPATDDRPFADDVFRWRALPEILALRTQGGAGLLEWGYLVLAATLAQAVLLGAVLVLLPLAGRGLAGTRAERTRTMGYFLAVGLAFLFIEIAFIERFTLFLGSPLYAVAVALAGFLVFAGAGSAAAPGLAGRLELRGVPPVPVAAGAVAGVALLYVLVLPLVLDRLMPLPGPVKVVLALALIAPLALPMGMPFPLGLARTPPPLVPWAWAINGAASVASAVLAALLARSFGFTVVVVLAAALYLAAASCRPRRA